MAQPSHSFIVGSFRSGTTLMRHILNSSQDIAICGETHFLGDLFGQKYGFRYKFAKIGNIATDDGAAKVVDYIYNLRVSNFWDWIQKNVAREEFLSRLLESDRTDRALFDLVMAFYANANGKSVRGEKTPFHIYYVPTLLEWFPQAKIVHIFRDPRAILASKKKKTFKRKRLSLGYRILRQLGPLFDAYLSLNVLIHWLHIVQLHNQYQQLYPDNYYFLKYEDLIRDPKISLEKLCAFLEINFSAAMLQQTVVNSGFVLRDDQVQDFDVSAIDRWRKYLHPVINYWFVLWCKKHLLEFGYQL